MRVQRYAEGDWFGIPLPTGGFGAGIVARANRDGVLLGYFYGPVRPLPPTLDDVIAYRPGEAALIMKFGDLGLRGGTWPVIGTLPGWDRDSWPIPIFHRYEELTGRYWLVFYDPDDPNSIPREELTDRLTALQQPSDGLGGHLAMEKRLARMLQPSARDIYQH